MIQHRNFEINHPDPIATTDVPDQYELFKKKGLHFLHINARSLLPKLTDARLLVQRTNAAVLAVTETWLDESVTNAEIELNGYIVNRKDRNRKGGGVCLYIRSDIAFNPKPELSTDDLESLYVNIFLPKTKPILIGVCYRPPTQTNFYKLLEESLESVSPDMEFILLGDFNTDLTNKNKTCSLVKDLYNFSTMFGLGQLIDSATRITCQCSSIWDLVFVSISDNVTQSGVLSVGFSDHLVIYCTRKIKKTRLGTHKSIKIRSLKRYNKAIFNEKLSECDFSVIYELSEVNEAWETFKRKFLCILNKIAPLKEVGIKQQSDPWVNSELLELIEQRDHNLKLFRKSELNEDYKNYLHFRNQVDYTTKSAKSMYFKESVADNKHKPKKLWGLLKNLGSSNKCKTKITNIGLKIKETICFDKLMVATHFNNFFCNIAENLVNKLHQ